LGKKGFFILTLIFVATMFPQPPALACSCVPDPPRHKLAESEAAFIGRLAKIQSVFLSFDSFLDTRWIFKVERVVKGSLHEEIPVNAPRGGPSCGLDLEIGDRAGLFISRQAGSWASSLCSKISPDLLSAAALPPPRPTGGEVRMLLSGGPPGAAVTALDREGKVVAYGPSHVPGEEVFVPGTQELKMCPGSRFALETTSDRRVHRRDLTTLAIEEIPGLAGVVPVSCTDNQGTSAWLARRSETAAGFQLSRFTPGGETQFPGTFGTVALHPTKEIAYAMADQKTLSILDLRTGQSTPLTNLSSGSLHLNPSGDKLLSVVSEGHEGGTLLVLVDLETLEQKQTRREWSSGPIAWIDDETFAFSVIDRAFGTPDDTLLIYNSDLEILRTIREFGAGSIIADRDLIVGAAQGALLEASVADGTVRKLANVESADHFPMLVGVPSPHPTVTTGAVAYSPSGSTVDGEVKLLSGRSPDFRTAMIRTLFVGLALVLAFVAALALLMLSWRRWRKPRFDRSATQ
jgi:hypothetical protein